MKSIPPPLPRWILFVSFILTCLRNDTPPAEDARVQENAAGDDLPDLLDHASQIRHLDRHLADLLLRVRGPSLGHRPARGAVHGVRCQVPRKVQGPAERRLLAKWVIYFIYIFSFFSDIFYNRSFVRWILTRVSIVGKKWWRFVLLPSVVHDMLEFLYG